MPEANASRGQLALRGRMLREGPMDEGCKQRGQRALRGSYGRELQATRATGVARVLWTRVASNEGLRRFI
jgi:hypothetical protein